MSLRSNENINWFIVVWNLTWCLVTVAENYNQVCVVSTICDPKSLMKIGVLVFVLTILVQKTLCVLKN